MIKNILSSFFKTIGRILAYLFIGYLLAYFGGVLK